MNNKANLWKAESMEVMKTINYSPRCFAVELNILNRYAISMDPNYSEDYYYFGNYTKLKDIYTSNKKLG